MRALAYCSFVFAAIFSIQSWGNALCRNLVLNNDLARAGIVLFESGDGDMLRTTAANPKIYSAKIQKSYSNKHIYRGTGVSKVLSEAEVIDLFFTPNALMTADAFVQEVLGQASKTKSGNLYAPLNESQGARVAEMIPDSFNRLANNPIALWGRLEAHKYHSDGSSLLSTTLEKYVARKFARGKKSTLILTALLPNKGAMNIERIGRANIKDLPQLLIYDAEIEVMVYGAIAPDSIMAIEYYNPITEKTTSYLRDPADPSKINVLDGPISD